MITSFQRAARRLRDTCGLQLVFSFGDNNPNVVDVVKEIQRALFNAIILAEEERMRAKARRDVDERTRGAAVAAASDALRYRLDERPEHSAGAAGGGGPRTGSDDEDAANGAAVMRKPIVSRITLGDISASLPAAAASAAAVQSDRNAILASQLQQPSNIKLLLLKQQQQALKEQQRKLDGALGAPRRPPTYHWRQHSPETLPQLPLPRSPPHSMPSTARAGVPVSPAPPTAQQPPATSRPSAGPRHGGFELFQPVHVAPQGSSLRFGTGATAGGGISGLKVSVMPKSART